MTTETNGTTPAPKVKKAKKAATPVMAALPDMDSQLPDMAPQDQATKPLPQNQPPLTSQAELDAIKQRMTEIEVGLQELPGRLDRCMYEAAATSIRNSPEVILEAILPHTGKVFRHGMAQTAVALVMAPITLLKMGVKMFTPTAVAPAAVAVPA